MHWIEIASKRISAGLLEDIEVEGVCDEDRGLVGVVCVLSLEESGYCRGLRSRVISFLGVLELCEDLELGCRFSFWNGRSASHADSRASEVVEEEYCALGNRSSVRW